MLWYAVRTAILRNRKFKFVIRFLPRFYALYKKKYLSHFSEKIKIPDSDLKFRSG